MVMKVFHSRYQPHKNFLNEGLSLIEVVLSVFIVSLVGIGIASVSQNIVAFNRYFNYSFTTGDQAQRLLRPMGQEIRSASVSNNGSYPLEVTQANEFVFYSDIDNDGLAERVRYYLSGTTLLKDIVKPTGSPLVYILSNKTTVTMATGVQNIANGNIPIFNYYDSTYTGSTTGEVLPASGNISLVRLVRITLLIDADPQLPPPAQRVTTLVSVRNLKQQL